MRRLSLATLASLLACLAFLFTTSRAYAGSPADVAKLALANVGGMACKTNSLGESSFDSSCTGNGGQPEYWCADFARWVWAKSGAQYTNELTAAAGSFYVYGQNHGTLKNTPAVGDAVVYNYAGNGYADHVALVTQVNANGTIETVSGDWDGQSGSEATFSATSHVVLNSPAYPGTVGSSPAVMGMTISGFISAAGLDTPYAAEYVSQSFPLASTALDMVEGQTISSYIELKNVGSKTWDSSTKLAPTPREHASDFADASWLSPTRAAAVTGTVPPGGSYKFKFDLHAPNKSGTYYQYFGLVQEGVAWFSDAGQGGPADNLLEVQIKVSTPPLRADFKDQTFPLAPTALALHQGDIVDGYIELTNTGSQTWKAGITKLAPTPRDKPSPFADPSWLSPTRISSVAADVAPGAVGRFPVKLVASQVGDFEVTFGLVDEGAMWFADSPGGAPADGFLKVHLVVAAASAPAPDGGAVTGGNPPGGGDAPDAGVGAGGDGVTADGASTDSGSSGGCAMAAGPRGSSLWGVAAALAMLAIRRRRVRRSGE